MVSVQAVGFPKALIPDVLSVDPRLREIRYYDEETGEEFRRLVFEIEEQDNERTIVSQRFMIHGEFIGSPGVRILDFGDTWRVEYLDSQGEARTVNVYRFDEQERLVEIVEESDGFRYRQDQHFEYNNGRLIRKWTGDVESDETFATVHLEWESGCLQEVRYYVEHTGATHVERCETSSGVTTCIPTYDRYFAFPHELAYVRRTYSERDEGEGVWKQWIYEREDGEELRIDELWIAGRIRERVFYSPDVRDHGLEVPERHRLEYEYRDE
ncbi:MAG: hypothetical protein EA383_15730 [Spirochaetaceae bacterium]|nr:MAG: hypothetical protein EA383_15730 [Spirochaetaceae bacterium]